MKKLEIRKLSGCIIQFFGISFTLTSIGLILSLVLGGSLSEYFLNEDGGSDYSWWKQQFWIILVAAAIFLFVGGKVNDLKFFNNSRDKSSEDKN